MRGRSLGNTVTAAVLALVALSVSVLAAVRTHDPLYLMTIVSTVALIATTARIRATREHPAERLLRLDDATAGHPTA